MVAAAARSSRRIRQRNCICEDIRTVPTLGARIRETAA
jgi:hypothetical protein